jgi:hypothetical protein
MRVDLESSPPRPEFGDLSVTMSPVTVLDVPVPVYEVRGIIEDLPCFGGFGFGWRVTVKPVLNRVCNRNPRKGQYVSIAAICHKSLSLVHGLF